VGNAAVMTVIVEANDTNVSLATSCFVIVNIIQGKSFVLFLHVTGIEAYLSGQLASFSALTLLLLVGSSDLSKLTPK